MDSDVSFHIFLHCSLGHHIPPVFVFTFCFIFAVTSGVKWALLTCFLSWCFFRFICFGRHYLRCSPASVLNWTSLTYQLLSTFATLLVNFHFRKLPKPTIHKIFRNIHLNNPNHQRISTAPAHFLHQSQVPPYSCNFSFLTISLSYRSTTDFETVCLHLLWTTGLLHSILWCYTNFRGVISTSDVLTNTY